jgi:glutathione S-transferase
MPVRLYQFATSPFCRKVRKILDYKGIEYDTVEVDYINRGPLLEASGQIRVPALSFEDGATVVDSEQIVLRLEEICAEPTIFPPEWGGIHLGLARYFDTVVEDALFRAAIPDEAAYYEAISQQHAAM